MAKIIIAAKTDNNVIGRNGCLPWKLAADLRFFKRITKGNAVLMGRKTWESLPKRPLPNRQNLVVTANKRYRAKGARIFNNLLAALEFENDNIFIIGGQQIYQQSIDMVDSIILTEVRASIHGDVFFPELDLSQWRVKTVCAYQADSENDYDYSINLYQRLK